jgi:hypothetical protein
MTQTMSLHGRAAIVLPPFATAVVISAAAGMMIVVAPIDLVSALGLRELRQGHDHVFGLAVLLLTAWASGIVAGRLATHGARQRFLASVPDIFDRLSAVQRQWILSCLQNPDLTLRRTSCDSIARGLCELGLLTPPPDAPHGRLWQGVEYVMPADIAMALRACGQARSGSARNRAAEGRRDARD